jgi:7-cyano-7-deazaguanine reductase
MKKTDKPDNKLLKVIDYEYPGKKIAVDIATEEFTCLCPWTGQPDFATVKINYAPDVKCIELKSLKLYFQSYRNAGIVHESVVNNILEDLVKICNPLEMQVTAEFNIRGGLKTTVTREYKR